MFNAVQGFFSVMGYGAIRGFNSLKGYVNAVLSFVTSAANTFAETCNGILLESEATNLLFNSGFVGGGAAPTNWTQLVGTGTSAPVASTLFSGAIAYEQTATAERPMFAQTSPSLLANTNYTMSMEIEAITGTVQAQQILLVTTIPAGAAIVFP